MNICDLRVLRGSRLFRLFATPSNVSESVELMDSGAGQSVLTRDVQKVAEVEAFDLEGHAENATYNKKAKLTPAHQCEKPDISHHEERSNPEPPIRWLRYPLSVSLPETGMLWL